MMRTLLLLVALAAGPAHADVLLRWAAQNDILTLDPHSQNHATTHAIMQYTYEGLTRYTKDYHIEPCLATSWDKLSETQYRFHLRKGVKFHDGSPFTADDVVFSFTRIKEPQGTNQIYVAGIKDVKKIDDYTVDLILEGPHPLLLKNIVDFRIMSKSWSEKNRSVHIQDYKAKEETFASRNTNGTGPYIVKGGEPDKRIVMTTNKNWWGKLDGNVTDVVYTPIKSDATRVSALLSGDVDLVTDLPTQDVERLRKELNMAVDREAIKKVVMRGLSIPAGIMIAPGVHGYEENIDLVPKYDPAGAKKVLAEAGYPNGFEFTLDCPNNRYVNDEKICQALVSMWARAGLKVRLNSMPFATYIPKLLNFDTSAYMLGWGVPTFDGLYTLQSLVRTKTTGADGSFNQGRISDKKLDE